MKTGNKKHYKLQPLLDLHRQYTGAKEALSDAVKQEKEFNVGINTRDWRTRSLSDTEYREYLRQNAEEKKATYDAVYNEYHDALQQLTDMIKAAEGRAKVRCVTAEEITRYVERYDALLAIPPSFKKGIEINVDLNSQSFPLSYNYAPKSTQFIARFANDGWRITKIYRGTCRCQSKRLYATLPEATKSRIMAKYERDM